MPEETTDSASLLAQLAAAQREISSLESRLHEVSESEQRFRSIVDDQTELICRYNDQFILTFVNPAYAARYHKTPEQMIGIGFLNQIPLEDRPIAIAHVRSLGPNRPFGVSVHRSMLPDGSIQWHEWTDRARMDAEGNIIEYQAVARNVTERKQQELFQSRLTEVLEAIADDEPLANVLAKLAHVVEAQQQKIKASVLLYEAATGTLRHGAGPSLPAAYNAAIDGARVGPAAGSCGTAVYEKRLIVTADIANDPLWTEEYRKVALEHDLRSSWSQPLLNRTGEVLGTFAIYRHEVYTPTTQDIDLLQMAAHIAEIAIRRQQEQITLREANSILEQRVQERTAELEGIKNHIVEERNLLRTLIDAVPAYIYVKDTQHRIILSNTAHTQSLRAINPDYSPGMTDAEVFPQFLALRFMQDDDEVLKQGKPILKREEQSIGENGESIWALTTKIPLRNLKGDISGLVGYTQDITYLKSNEAALQQKHDEELQMQEYFRALHAIGIELTGIDSMDLFYRIAIDLALKRLGFTRIGLLRYDPASNTAVGTYGTDVDGNLASEESLHIPLTPESPMWKAMESPDRIYLRENVTITDREIPVGVGWNVVVALRHGGQTLGWLCADNLVSQKPLTPITIEVMAQYAMFLASSIARKNTEQALGALSQRLELATQAGEIGIWDWDIAHDSLTWDDRMFALYGLSRHEASNRGSMWLDALHPDDLLAAQTDVAKALQGEAGYRGEFRIVRPDGTIRHIKEDAIVLWDANGNPARMIGTSQDITAIKTALERERELGELKSRFVSMASHEFRTPLATILSTTDILIRYRARMNDEQLEDKLNTTRVQALHMRDMMEDMLQLTRIQSGRIDFRPSQRDLDLLCREIVSELDALPQYRNRIRYSSTAAPLNAYLDAQLMRQVINNLIGNALKYSPADKPVDVCLQVEDQKAILTVKDEGIGIAPEDIKHLFVPFHRGVNVENISGTGLGLSIANQAVIAHEGAITVESELNLGTTFVVTVPIKIGMPQEGHGDMQESGLNFPEPGMIRPAY